MTNAATDAEVRELTADENRELDQRLGELGTASRRVIGRPFTPGNNANPYGRAGNPAKKTMVSELRRKADRNASGLAQSAIDAAKRGNVRALTFIRDTAYGVPAQKLVVERADDPLATWLATIQGIAPLPALPEATTEATTLASKQIIDAAPPIDVTDT